jgi:hypothetical protein
MTVGLITQFCGIWAAAHSSSKLCELLESPKSFNATATGIVDIFIIGVTAVKMIMDNAIAAIIVVVFDVVTILLDDRLDYIGL